MKNMRGLSRGGVELPRRAPYTHQGIENAYLPIQARVPVPASPEGRDARILVSEGQELREGQLIARAEGKGAANIHSPIPGYVRRIERKRGRDGLPISEVVISLAGAFSISGKRQERYIWKSLNKGDILHIIQDKGVVQASTGKPVYDLLHARFEGGHPRLVINALEMDPYRRVEEAILIERLPALLDACDIVAKVLKPRAVYCAVERGLDKAIVEAIEAAAAEAELPIEIRAVPRRYPADMSSIVARQLADAEGENYMPAEWISLEPSVLLAVHDAVVLNKAHMEQYVYVGGGAINEARVVKARIGSPIGDLIEECGGFRGEAASVVVNDPLCGWAAADLDEAVDKRTRSVIALSPEEAHRAPLRPCVRCGSCVDACPEGLEPYMLYKLIAAGRRDEAMELGLGRCSSCAACSWACWSRLPLVTAFDAAKGAEGA